MDVQTPIMEALTSMEAEAAKLEREVARLQDELRFTITRLEHIRAGITGVKAFLQTEDKAVDQAAGEQASVKEPVPPTPSEQLAFETVDVPPAPPFRKRFRSTQFVADLLARNPRIWSFEEIVQAFADEGASAGMQNPEGAIRTALLRAMEKHGVVMVDDDHFHAKSLAPQRGSDG